MNAQVGCDSKRSTTEKTKANSTLSMIATAFKIAKSYDQAVQAYVKASEALSKADACVSHPKRLIMCIKLTFRLVFIWQEKRSRMQHSSWHRI